MAGLHDWAELKSVSEVQSFLGFTFYYRRFVKNFRKLTVPLERLLKKKSTWKDNEHLPEDAIWAFEVLKQSLMD